MAGRVGAVAEGDGEGVGGLMDCFVGDARGVAWFSRLEFGHVGVQTGRVEACGHEREVGSDRAVGVELGKDSVWRDVVVCVCVVVVIPEEEVVFLDFAVWRWSLNVSAGGKALGNSRDVEVWNEALEVMNPHSMAVVVGARSIRCEC